MKRTILFCMLVLAMIISTGCKSKESKKQPKTVRGTIESIDLSTNIVTMNFFNEKAGRSIPLAGKITPETEILIDGKITDISQLKVDDDVIVEGYKKGIDIVPVKVSVIRQSASVKKIKSSTQPASTQPAEDK